METDWREESKKVAEEIVHMANMGGNLHVNDILPDIIELLHSQLETLVGTLEKMKIGLFDHPEITSPKIKEGYNRALSDVQALLTAQINTPE